MSVPTGVKYQPTPSAWSDTPAALPKLLTLMPTWPGSTRVHEVSGTTTISGTSRSGAKRRYLFMVFTPEDERELAVERRDGQIAAGERDDRDQRRADVGEVAVQGEQGRHDESEAGYPPGEERAASQPEAHEP